MTTPALIGALSRRGPLLPTPQAAAPPAGDYEGPTPLQSAKAGDALTSAGAVAIESQEPSA